MEDGTRVRSTSGLYHLGCELQSPAEQSTEGPHIGVSYSLRFPESIWCPLAQAVTGLWLKKFLFSSISPKGATDHFVSCVFVVYYRGS